MTKPITKEAIHNEAANALRAVLQLDLWERGGVVPARSQTEWSERAILDGFLDGDDYVVVLEFERIVFEIGLANK